MTRLKAYCVGCGTPRVFVGETIEDITKDIDVSGWKDRPKKHGPGVEFFCPKCLRQEAGKPRNDQETVDPSDPCSGMECLNCSDHGCQYSPTYDGPKVEPPEDV